MELHVPLHFQAVEMPSDIAIHVTISISPKVTCFVVEENRFQLTHTNVRALLISNQTH